MLDYNKIAINVRVRRALLKISQKELADKTGLNIATISFIENCTKKVRIETLTKIATAMNCSVEDLIY